MNYLDFDLAIETLPGTSATYRARVLNSPAGQATVDFTLPFDAHELENYILKMGRPRRKVRSLTQEGEAARAFGAQLYNVVFQGDVRDALRRSLDAANAQPEQGLRLCLRLGAATELLDLPWEYLYDPSLRRFFCHSVATPLVRYPEQPRSVTPLPVTLPLQVLVMIANPSDVSTLDVEGEWHKIQESLNPLVEKGQVQLTRLPNATLTALQRQLRQGRYHIFHFVGHGGVDRLSGERVLYLEDDTGRVRSVSGDYLGTLLSDHRSLRLALLNACEGARVGLNDPFAGVAQHLVLQGIPAIIAMQFEISAAAALILAQEFYGAIADGYPVEAALTEARKAIFVAGHEVEWGTPVLYSRASDGRSLRWLRAQWAPAQPPRMQALKIFREGAITRYAMRKTRPPLPGRWIRRHLNPLPLLHNQKACAQLLRPSGRQPPATNRRLTPMALPSPLSMYRLVLFKWGQMTMIAKSRSIPCTSMPSGWGRRR